jgi:Zn-finger domain-containing protein
MEIQGISAVSGYLDVLHPISKWLQDASDVNRNLPLTCTYKQEKLEVSVIELIQRIERLDILEVDLYIVDAQGV